MPHDNTTTKCGCSLLVIINYLQHYVLIIIINFHILIEKLCLIVKIFISQFYNNLKIMRKIAVIYYTF